MRLRLLRLAEYLRSSLWVIPGAFVLLAFAAAEGLVALDRTIDEGAVLAFGGGADSARTVLSVIAASMLSFTALVFTVTMLVLQLATSQLSPRVMRTFLRDRVNQVVLGTFVATFSYALLLLREVRSPPNGDPFVPGVAVWFAIASVLGAVGVFIFYINHMSHAIRASTVIASVARETRQTLERLYPEEPAEHRVEATGLPSGPPRLVVASPRSGVITAVDRSRLVELASEHDGVVELPHAPGDFVAEDAPLFRVWKGDGLTEEALDDTVNLGRERTMQQDAAFGLRQLVDIAERALSPGINDPTTAVQVLDAIHDVLRRLAVRPFPPAGHADEDGTLRLVVKQPSWDDYVNLALDEIRHYGRDSVQVTGRIRRLLDDLVEAAPDRTAPLDRQRRLLDDVLARHQADAEGAEA